MSMMFDTPEGVAFVKAAARKGALELEIQGMHRSGGRQTAYSIVKQVYGFRGSRERVLEDLTEYIECEIRIKKMAEADFAIVSKVTQDVIDKLGAALTQPKFEHTIAEAWARGAISEAVRARASDLFYVMIVRTNAAANEGVKHD